MKKYITAVGAEFSNMRQFALNFALQSLQLPVAIMILLYIYGTLTGSRALDLSLYFVGVAVAGQVSAPAMVAMWESWEQINNGDLSIWLCRPVDHLWLRYSRKLAPALVMAACAAVIQVSVRLVLGTWSLVSTLQFVLAALLAFSLWFMWWVLLGALSFWWERPFGLRDIMWNVVAILSGQLFPVDLLHPVLQQAIAWLPFQGLAYVPAAIFAGTLTGAPAWAALAQQAFWLAALTAGARALWAVGIKSYDGRGG